MDTKIEDYKLKPLRKLFRPYFSPNFNSYEMDYTLSNFLINTTKVYKHYSILINFNTKFIFGVPIQNNYRNDMSSNKRNKRPHHMTWA
jgi:hypothetical protein